VKYTHLELDRDIEALAGYYTPRKEVRLPYEGREVLYVISRAVVDASCCGVADFNCALVPGYVVRWRAETNGEGLPVSEVEPVTDPVARVRVRKIIQETEDVSQVEFW
jgi:hypothetical protein